MSNKTDVVIVGGGTAGSVVAARLAGSGSTSVVLVEAGPDKRADPPPGLTDGWHLNRDFYWGFVAEPDDRGPGMNAPCNRILGGTSWMTRFAVRGSAADFDEWAALGNAGWAFADMLPYFTRIESDADFPSQRWHGDHGPIHVDRYQSVSAHPVVDAVTRVLIDNGFPDVADHNRPGAVGVGRMPMSTRDGRRITVADAYLSEGRPNPDLQIRSESPVSRVLMDGSVARGIELVDGTVIEADQVVVSAGVFGSPAILLRSGIGPASDLVSHQLVPVVDLPGVGAGLGDHPATDIDCGYSGTGRKSPILHSIATFHSSSADDGDPPDLMLWFADPESEEGEAAEFFIDIVLLKPKSRGSVTLRSADPLDPPRITLPSLDEPTDLDRLVEGHALAAEVSRASDLRRFFSPPDDLPADAEEIRAKVRQNSYSIPHFTGTCRMGPEGDLGAVVDEHGRVHGTENLRVIDASIMPTVISGFPHLATIAIAERLSGEIVS